MDRAKRKYIISLLLFGSNGVWAAQIPLAGQPIIFFRTALGGMLLFGLLLLLRKHQRPLAGKQVVGAALSGAALGGAWMCLYGAYDLISVGMATMLYYCGPLLLLLFLVFVLRQSMPKEKWMGAGVIFCGLFVLSVQHLSDNWQGLLLGLGSAVGYVLTVVFDRQTKRMDGLEKAAIQLAAACGVVVMYFIATGESIAWPGKEGILPLLWLGVVNTAIGCYLYFSSLTKIPMGQAAVIGYVEPVSAIVFSAICLGEHVSVLEGLGAALIIGGGIFGEKVRWSRRNQHGFSA